MALTLTIDERAELEGRLRSRTIRAEDARRARVVLMLADGASYSMIEATVPCVFITISRFAGTAEDYVKRGSQLKLVLIDGDQLADLMLRHQIGVRVERQANVLALDNNYFEDDQ